MNIFKKVAVSVFVLAVLFGSMPVAQAQEPRPEAGTKVFLPSVVSGSSANVNDLVVTQVISESEQEATQEFWTREAIASAQPLEIVVEFGPSDIDAAQVAEPEAQGPYGFTRAGNAPAGADLIAQAAYPLDWQVSEEELESIVEDDFSPRSVDGTSGVYTSYMLSNSALQNMYPHPWVGRLSLRTANGTTAYCSGTSISGNVMLTAAHCLYDTTNNRWYTNIVFTPAYRDGKAPYGTFTATDCWVLTSWANLTGSYSINSWAQHDVGVCKMGNNSSRSTLNNAVGHAGREWNASYTRHIYGLGYPFRSYTNNLLSNAGLYLRTCVAESRQGGTEFRSIGCNLGGGISGGPWMTGYALGAVSGQVTGVNSGIYVGEENMYGARFNSNNIVPLCNAAGC